MNDNAKFLASARASSSELNFGDCGKTLPRISKIKVWNGKNTVKNKAIFEIIFVVRVWVAYVQDCGFKFDTFCESRLRFIYLIYSRYITNQMALWIFLGLTILTAVFHVMNQHESCPTIKNRKGTPFWTFIWDKHLYWIKL